MHCIVQTMTAMLVGQPARPIYTVHDV